LIGLGIVVRDCCGLILGAKCIAMEMVADSSLAEVMGALYAVQFCKEVDFFDVLFEGDANTVVKEINLAPPFFF
jgi:ribonuclease HI